MVGSVRTRIIKHPQGIWEGIAAIPLPAGVFTVREIVDTRDFKKAAARRLGAAINCRGQQISARSDGMNLGGAIGSLPDDLRRTYAIAKKAADAIIDHDARAALMHKLGLKIQAVVDFAEKFAKSFSKGTTIGAVPSARFHLAIGRLLERIEHGDQVALSSIVEMAKRVPADPRATQYMMGLVEYSAATPAAMIIYNLFRQQGLLKFAAVMQARLAR